MNILTHRTYLGLGVVFFIAYHGSETTPVSGAAITKHYNLKKRALEPVLQILSREQFLQSVRGQGGGYYIAHPENITLKDIITCFTENPMPLEDAFSEFMSILNDPINVSYQSLLEKLEKITIAAVAEKASQLDLPKLDEHVLSFVI
ncbi:MAG: RrF2 family transcriptional regulator [Alphaproteobacteria bacterium]